MEVKQRRLPGWPAAVSVSVALVLAVAVLRVWMYPNHMVPLGYALPLLIALWHRRRSLLWGMAVCYLTMAVLKMYWVLPVEYFIDQQQMVVFLLMQWLSIVAPAIVLHLVIDYGDRIERANRDLVASNAELAAREEEISCQNEELQVQAEELEQQSEELRTQSAELQTINAELAQREGALQALLEVTQSTAGEKQLWDAVCAAAPKLLGEESLAAAMLESVDGHFAIRSHCGFGERGPASLDLPAECTIAARIVERRQSAQMADVSLRPDLQLPQPAGDAHRFRSMVSVPIGPTEAPTGVLEVYAADPREWTLQQAQLLQWLAMHASQISEAIRLRERIRDSELYHRQLIDALPALIWTARPDGYVDFVSRQRIDYTGQAHGNLGDGWAAALHPEDRPLALETWKAATKARAPYEAEYRLRRHDGVYRWFKARAVPIHSFDGKIVHWLGSCTDIEDAKRYERSLEEAKQAAEQANEAKSRFLANVSHELRTPMNSIMGMIDLALNDDMPLESRDYLQTARSSADVLLNLLNELLDLSRIEAGKFRLDHRPFRLRRAVNDAVKMLEVQAQRQDLSLTCRIREDVPDDLVGDASRLQQVVINLVGNAIKFTPQGSVAIDAQVYAAHDDHVCLEFSVSDTGIGIAPDDLEHIFTPFAQADSSTTRQYGGTGLGLTISSHFVRMMGGKMWVKSEPGVGTTFFFTAQFPLTREPMPAPTPARPAAPLISPAARPIRILLAEDTPANQKLVSRILEKAGHSVAIAHNGQEAVDCVAQEDFDLVLMDVQMPIMDGLQATAAIRRLPDPRKAGVTIIAMTAYALKQDQDQCMASGMDSYLSKPISAVELLRVAASVGADEAADIN
jgi:two-component system CheB/CheR fusion protein